MKENIFHILKKDRPKRLRWHKREREIEVRKRRELNIILTRKKRPDLKILSFMVNRVIGILINFKKIGTASIHDYILKVERLEQKEAMLKMKSELEIANVKIDNDYTKRERELDKWLKEKEEQLVKIGVQAKTMYLGGMGMLINGCKWIWDEEKGKLIKINSTAESD